MERKDNTLSDAIVRGIMLGGAIGLIAALIFDNLQRGLMLGMLSGVLAVLTFRARGKK